MKWSDANRLFLISFIDNLPRVSLETALLDEPESAFQLDDEVELGVRLVKARPGQAKFKFDVLERYGSACAVCSVDVPAVIEAAHILPKGKKGSDDARNGLPLCATHHRAFDAGFFAFEPETSRITFRGGGPDAGALRITMDGLSHLPKLPHEDALAWRWKRFRGNGDGAWIQRGG